MSLAPQMTLDSWQTSTAGRQQASTLLNVVEPDYLVDVFMNNPPLDFVSMWIKAGSAATPAYFLNFSLLTTLGDEAEAVHNFVKKFPFVKRFLCYPSIFVSTTISEYANYPDVDDYRPVISSWQEETRRRKAQIMIVRDIPQASPLLSQKENEKAELLMRQCQEAGFTLIDGQALAYVPVDFVSIDDYLKRLSKTRRKEFRKKLKESSHVQVDELSCGDQIFFDDSFLDTMYRMYENVFSQSEIHFDILSRTFFRDLLQNANGGGKVFCYKVAGKLIGYNICFVHGRRLVDKYVGFVYPDARAANLYFLSWFYNLEYVLKNNLECYIAGWTDPAVKKSLGAKFTLTRHAVYIRNPILRHILKLFRHSFESDSDFIDKNADSEQSGSQN